MGREFDQLFNQWAATYDDTVMGKDLEYKDVFLHYDNILTTVAEKAVGTVLEFGVGTGNLTKRLIDKNHKVYGIEPSEEMRHIAKRKLPSLTVFDGDFINFPLIEERIHSIVSSYAFHHLTDDEKNEAISIYKDLLQPGDKIIFADTIFESEEAKLAMIKKAKNIGFNNLSHDLETEYYTTIPILEKIFTDHQFSVHFKQMNDFVWILEAEKRK